MPYKGAAVVYALMVGAAAGGLTFLLVSFLPTKANSFLIKTVAAGAAGALRCARYPLFDHKSSRCSRCTIRTGYLGVHYILKLFIPRPLCTVKKYEAPNNQLRRDRHSYFSLLPREVWEQVRVLTDSIL